MLAGLQTDTVITILLLPTGGGVRNIKRFYIDDSV